MSDLSNLIINKATLKSKELKRMEIESFESIKVNSIFHFFFMYTTKIVRKIKR